MRRERAVRKIVTVTLLSYSIGVQLCLPRDRRYFLLDPPRESLEAVPAWPAPIIISAWNLCDAIAQAIWRGRASHTSLRASRVFVD